MRGAATEAMTVEFPFQDDDDVGDDIYELKQGRPGSRLSLRSHER